MSAALLAGAAVLSLPGDARAQVSAVEQPSEPSATLSVGGSLPDAPSASAAEAAAGGGMSDPQPGSTPQAMSPHAEYVLPNHTAPRLTATNKVVMGLEGSVTPFAMAGWVVSAGYTHLVNGNPNYGTNGKAFAQRLGAAAARGASQEVFTVSVLAPLLHQDPRYYIMGKGHSIFARTVHAGLQPVIARTDGGHKTINFALLGGYAGAAALSNIYVPPINQGFSEQVKAFGGSVGGAAIGYVVSEFLNDLLAPLHLVKAY